jgi:hypothetical protein
MPKRSSKKPKGDLNTNAFDIVKQATGGSPKSLPVKKPEPAKNPAAVALGRLGGVKGGKARAQSLSAERRIEIAKQAAASRWKDNGR